MHRYSDKYADELLAGMREDGKSIVECCLIWGITDRQYEQWLKEHKKLQYAHEIGEMHCAAWWHLKYRDLAEKGNASALAFGMKNIEKVGWQDRPESKREAPEPVTAIAIRILPPRKDG